MVGPGAVGAQHSRPVSPSPPRGVDRVDVGLEPPGAAPVDPPSAPAARNRACEAVVDVGLSIAATSKTTPAQAAGFKEVVEATRRL
jgi:hypothetical protein